MPFPFVLPTTRSFSFTSFFTCDSHPSLPLTASTYRGVFRDTLKKYKRLSPAEQVAYLPTVFSSLNDYIPYLFAIDQGLSNQILSGQLVSIVLQSTPTLEWRPTLSDSLLPGRRISKIKVESLEYEIYFTLSTLAYTHTLLAQTSLNPLYSLDSALPSLEQRTLIISTASKHLLSAASIHEYLSVCCEQILIPSPCVDLSQYTFKALASLALAEATLLVVLKDDPYPFIIAQERNKCDKEWMIKPPEMPKVRANLLARLCLAAAEHASKGLSILSNASSDGKGKINHDLLKYMEEFKSTSQGKACRFLGIGAELNGQIGTAIAWLQAGMYQLGMSAEDTKMRGLKRLKKDWEGKKLEKKSQWGADAGKLEELRILDLLEYKWSKENDTINAQPIPPVGPLIAMMPSGREIHSLKPFIPPVIEASILESLKSSDSSDELAEESESVDSKACSEIQSNYSCGGGYF
ncbi:pH-response regulator protein [Erysiphe necator]|uniref:pH-response regulator protein palC n=1 Tax=Uncinula necator TaxID=52586 RepID=A0A0B1P1G7_UNCNE|nr:pH-response regulator protein [Erysiphe necator]KHJ31135.1 putative ph-response regulator protein palc [Erysiphe necator]